MANYPSYSISIDSTQDLESGIDDDYSQTGIQHSRIYHSQQYYRFEIIHPNLTLTEFNSLKSTYAAGPRDVYTLTYLDEGSPQTTYSVKFMQPPMITGNHGLNRFEVTVRLRGFKD